ncbi:unnamed protein product [Prorocentrum cordatum]|uniref:Uncharacterized protein n=1 Tax=Prorocentrum cordatum TaxID=2364126 RepID=A0ABN9TT28_9DINO|nr:unnamed protein product [Polarella glacialis]
MPQRLWEKLWEELGFGSSRGVVGEQPVPSESGLAPDSWTPLELEPWVALSLAAEPSVADAGFAPAYAFGPSGRAVTTEVQRIGGGDGLDICCCRVSRRQRLQPCGCARPGRLRRAGGAASLVEASACAVGGRGRRQRRGHPCPLRQRSGRVGRLPPPGSHVLFLLLLARAAGFGCAAGDDRGGRLSIGFGYVGFDSDDCAESETSGLITLDIGLTC